jgi:hypothetical protein
MTLSTRSLTHRGWVRPEGVAVPCRPVALLLRVATCCSCPWRVEGGALVTTVAVRAALVCPDAPPVHYRCCSWRLATRGRPRWWLTWALRCSGGRRS